MKVLTVYVSTEDDMALAEDVANALHGLVADTKPYIGEQFSPLDFVVSVDAEVPA